VENVWTPGASGAEQSSGAGIGPLPELNGERLSTSGERRGEERRGIPILWHAVGDAGGAEADSYERRGREGGREEEEEKGGGAAWWSPQQEARAARRRLPRGSVPMDGSTSTLLGVGAGIPRLPDAPLPSLLVPPLGLGHPLTRFRCVPTERTWSWSVCV
jgi:hypothetical protein